MSVQEERDDLEEDLEELKNEVAALSQDLQGLRQLVVQQDSTIDDLEEELRKERRLRQALEERVAANEEANNLVASVAENGGSDYERYGAVVLQALYREAVQADTNTASMDASKCVDTLHHQIERTNTYRLLRKLANEWTDTDAVYFVEHPDGRSNKRLVVDLDEGDVPRRLNGHSITEGESA